MSRFNLIKLEAYLKRVACSQVLGWKFLEGPWILAATGDKSPFFFRHSKIRKVGINGVINGGAAWTAAKMKLPYFWKNSNNIGGVLENK